MLALGEIVTLQWGRGFAATEGQASFQTSPRPRRFNGAVASQPRKVGAKICDSCHCRASMGPWLRSHGRSERLEQWQDAHTLQWGRGFAATEGCTSHSCWPVMPRLQWGRGFAATEGLWWRCLRSPRYRLQWGRGFAATEGSCQPPPTCETNDGFNGAVASQPRKGRQQHHAGAARVASMGPWLRSHGRVDAFAVISASTLLQWGRGFAATEGRHHCQPRRTACTLQWGRGFAATEGVTIASPCRLECGFNGAVASQPRKERK